MKKILLLIPLLFISLVGYAQEVKNIDLILICVKTWQLVEVAEKIKAILNFCFSISNSIR